MKKAEKTYDFFAYVGCALTSWASVERALAQVFCQSISPQTIHPHFGSHVSARAFWSARSLHGRLKMTHEVCCANYYAHQDLISDWKELKRRITDGNKIRARIAHGQVTQHSSTSNMPNEVYFQPYPSEKSAGKKFFESGDGLEHPKMSLDDLDRAVGQFRQLAKDLMAFTAAVFAKFNPDGDINRAWIV